MSSKQTVRALALPALAAAVFLPSPAAAQIDSALLSKLSFNLTNPGGKSLAMGGAFTAIALAGGSAPVHELLRWVEESKKNAERR